MLLPPAESARTRSAELEASGLCHSLGLDSAPLDGRCASAVARLIAGIDRLLHEQPERPPHRARRASVRSWLQHSATAHEMGGTQDPTSDLCRRKESGTALHAKVSRGCIEAWNDGLITDNIWGTGMFRAFAG